MDQYGQNANPCKLPKGEGAKMNEGIGQGRGTTWRRETSLFPFISRRQAIGLIEHLLLGKAEMSQQQVNRPHICPGKLVANLLRAHADLPQSKGPRVGVATTFLLGHSSDLPTFTIRLVGISSARRNRELGDSKHSPKVDSPVCKRGYYARRAMLYTRILG